MNPHQSPQILTTPEYHLNGLIANNQLTLTLTSNAIQSNPNSRRIKYQIILPSLEAVSEQTVNQFQDFERFIQHMAQQGNVQVTINNEQSATIKVIIKMQVGKKIREKPVCELVLQHLPNELSLPQQLDNILLTCQTQPNLQNKQIKEMINILTKSMKEILTKQENNNRHQCKVEGLLKQMIKLYDDVGKRGNVSNNGQSDCGCGCKYKKELKNQKLSRMDEQKKENDHQIVKLTQYQQPKNALLLSDLTNYTEHYDTQLQELIKKLNETNQNYSIKLQQLTKKLGQTNQKISSIEVYIQRMQSIRTQLVEEFRQSQQKLYEKYTRLFDLMDSYFRRQGDGTLRDLENLPRQNPNQNQSILITQQFQPDNISNYRVDHRSLSQNINEPSDQPEQNNQQLNSPHSAREVNTRLHRLNFGNRPREQFTKWQTVSNKSNPNYVSVLDMNMIRTMGNLIISRINVKKFGMFAGIGFIDSSLRYKNRDEYGNKWIYYRNDKYLWDGNSAFQSQGKGFRVGDIVELSMNLESGEIQWKVGMRTTYKIQWLNFDKNAEWIPFIYMYGVGDQAEVLI